VLTLRDGPALLVDVLELAIMVLAVAHSVATNAGLAGPFFAVDEHDGLVVVVVKGEVWRGWLSCGRKLK
jgi:hypothetical protein